MYKCSDCNKTYSIKPDYCDCGNDIFEEILSPDTQNQYKASKHQVTPKSFDEQYPEIKKFIASLDVLSVTIFIICILLSILAVVFIKPSPQVSSKETKSVKSVSTKKVPNIDEIWVDSVKIPKTQTVQKNNSVTETINNKINTQSVKKQNQTKTLKNSQTASKPTSKTVSKTTNKKVSTATKTTTSNVVKQTSNQPTTVKKASAPTPQKKTSTTSTQEWYNYKLNLRQALFSNLAISSISGSGKCGIEFSLDSSGKLVNRAFTYQSPNDSVNKAVYRMLMKLPKYSPPPSSYKGEKIKMIFSFDNGSYYINYVN